MDRVYRGQRHIYDLTRKYYLFGRDRLVAGLACQPGDSVLEMACGTGRNLELVGKRWPGVRRFGFDISREMLKNAGERFDGTVRLAQADATRFDPQALFGQPGFDRIILSYSLSMIPDWRAALVAGTAALNSGGSLHVVDFGDLGGMPGFAATALRAWLRKFHVEPRDDLCRAAETLAAERGLSCRFTRGPLGYFQMVVVTRQ
ncbi:MAG: class I SAM-dependent methyltransferase [Sphingomonadales bacterium]|nr:class I SAM-dependent methyltransferase [Sphingomonadales bacterium]MBD3775343.1 class I SAM-dependent methyltransferase [Paracoccaceae bacterium]